MHLCRINEYNANALIACGLPYHATNHFVRLVQILHLEQTCWRFLSPMQKTGAAMPRALLVQRCVNDQVWRCDLTYCCRQACHSACCMSMYAILLLFYAILERVCTVAMLLSVNSIYPFQNSAFPTQAVLKSMCEAAKAVSNNASASSSMQSFYAVLLCELLLATHPVCGLLCVMKCILHRKHHLCVTGYGMMIMITITDLI